MVLPNFIIIGAAKSGTTAIYHYLKQHPQVYMSPKKETNFFALEGEKLNYKEPGVDLAKKNPVDNITDYRKLFQGVSSEIAIGEASPWYLYNAKVPERIKNYLPKAKLIAILRNPADRAYSHFSDFRLDGKEHCSDFAQVLQDEETRKRENWHPLWHYKQMGFYYVQLKRYFDLFDRKQIRVYLYEDFKSDPLGLMKNLFHYIGVDETFIPDMSLRHNVSGIPKSQVLQTFLKKRHPLKNVLKPFLPEKLRLRILVSIENRNLKKKPQLSSEIRQQLLREYRGDIFKLQNLIQQDLTQWLN